MINNILIFRTDRIGDLLFSCPAIVSIKNNFSNCKISLVASNKNFDYAKQLNIFDDVFLLDEKNFIKKIKLIRTLSKRTFDYVLVFDGKDRSIISAIFAKSKNKIAVIPKKKLNTFWKFFNINFIEDDENQNIIDIHQKVLDKCEINKSINNFNFLSKKKDNNYSSKINVQDYIHIHLDEKWINDLYIKSYTDINISYDKFIKFIKNISKNNNVLITSGMIHFNLLDDLMKNFTLLNDNIYHKSISNNSVFFVYMPSFNDLESLLRKSKFLVSCHGAITHAANSLNVKIVDILEKNKSSWYRRFNLYLKNYKIIYRSDFESLSKEIIEFF